MLTPDRQRPRTEPGQVRACLERILASRLFARSERQRRFLEFIATETLAGRGDRLKGCTIGLHVFDRDPGFDPAVDSIVRVEASRLRAKLREYYEEEGSRDPVRFLLPKGSYTPVVRALADATPPRGRPPGPAIGQPPSVGVLPFTSLGGDPAQQLLADGLGEDLAAELARSPEIRVVSRHAAGACRTVPGRPDEIGRRLGVRHLVYGAVRGTAGRVRVTVQLIEAASGAQVWAERYDRDARDVLAVQEDLARRIGAALRAALTPAGRGDPPGADIRPEARACLLRGVERFWAYTRESSEQAQALFAGALELDPGSAAAHAWLARVLAFRWAMAWAPDASVLDDALAHARLAVDLDPDLPLARPWTSIRISPWRARSWAG